MGLCSSFLKLKTTHLFPKPLTGFVSRSAVVWLTPSQKPSAHRGLLARTFAVNRDRPLRVLADIQEPSHDVVAGCAAIDEEEVIVLEASIGEALRLVNLFVQPHDCSHVMLFEIRKVGFGGMKRIT